MVKIAVSASFNMDLVMRVDRRPEAGETLQGEFATHLGGKGFNQAVAARRLGADVVVCGRVGDDEFGRRFLAALDEEGIDRRAVVVDPAAGTGVATIYVEPDGTNTIVQAPRANRNVTAQEIETGHWPLHGEVQMLLGQLETSMPGLSEFAKTSSCSNAGFILNPAPAAPIPDSLLESAYVVVPNVVELQTLTAMLCPSIDAAYEAARALRRRGAARVVVTLGESGALLAAANTRTHVPGFPVSVVDTTGAGDAFCGALAVRLAEGAELADAMRFANAAGALACTKHGAYPSMPYLAEVEELMREQGSSR